MNVATDQWYDLFVQIADLYIPHKTITVNNGDLPYMTQHLKKLIKSKDKYFTLLTQDIGETDIFGVLFGTLQKHHGSFWLNDDGYCLLS